MGQQLDLFNDNRSPTFAFPKPRSWEMLLDTYDDELIMEALGVPIVRGKFCSPFREDRRPTCNLRRGDNNRLYYRDWAIMSKSMDVFKLYQHLYGGTFDNTVKCLWQMMEGTSGQNPHRIHQVRITPQPPAKITVRSRTMDRHDHAWWRQFNISPELLEMYRVTAVRRCVLNGETYYHYFPPYTPSAYAYEFEDGYKVYFPHRKSSRFISNTHAVQGYDQLAQEGKGVVITKALKDVMTLRSFGVNAVAPQSENTPVSDELIEELTERFGKVLVFMDNDLPGISAMKYYKEKNLTVCMIPRAWGAKDLSDYCRDNGPKETGRIIGLARKFYLKSV